MKGKFICFEGIEGSGKSTMLRHTEKYLNIVIKIKQNGTRKKGRELQEARRANRRVDLIFTRPTKKERTRKFFPEPNAG